MMEKWYDIQWQTGLQPGFGQTCRINIAQMGVTMAEVQTVDKTKIMTVIVNMDKTVGVDMIAFSIALVICQGQEAII